MWSSAAVEEFSLKNRGNIGDNNNEPRMQWLLAEEPRKSAPLLVTNVNSLSRVAGKSCSLSNLQALNS
jgi:hypothetical protein